MFRPLLAAVVVAGLAIPAASAMTVVNQDKTTAHFVFIPKHGKAMHVALKAHHYQSFDCKAGGELTLGKSTEVCSAKTAKVWIKGGKLVI